MDAKTYKNCYDFSCKWCRVNSPFVLIMEEFCGIYTAHDDYTKRPFELPSKGIIWSSEQQTRYKQTFNSHKKINRFYRSHFEWKCIKCYYI